MLFRSQLRKRPATSLASIARKGRRGDPQTPFPSRPGRVPHDAHRRDGVLRLIGRKFQGKEFIATRGTPHEPEGHRQNPMMSASWPKPDSYHEGDDSPSGGTTPSAGQAAGAFRLVRPQNRPALRHVEAHRPATTRNTIPRRHGPATWRRRGRPRLPRDVKNVRPGACRCFHLPARSPAKEIVDALKGCEASPCFEPDGRPALDDRPTHLTPRSEGRFLTTPFRGGRTGQGETPNGAPRACTPAGRPLGSRPTGAGPGASIARFHTMMIDWPALRRPSIDHKTALPRGRPRPAAEAGFLDRVHSVGGVGT